jgi:hypothetical protein
MEEYRKDFEGFKAYRVTSVNADRTPLLGLGDVQVIHWRHPKHMNLSGTFIIHGGRVHAYGDFDDKMYRFNDVVSLRYFASESTGHFAEKCTTGRDEWDANVAEQQIRQYVAEFIEQCGDDEERTEPLRAISDMEYSEAAYGTDNASTFANEYEFESEFFYRCGKVVDHVCVRHLVALKMIAEQLEVIG